MPSPDDYIIQSAHQWRQTEKELLGASPEEKRQKGAQHYRARKNLRTAVDLAVMKSEEPKKRT